MKTILIIIAFELLLIFFLLFIGIGWIASIMKDPRNRTFTINRYESKKTEDHLDTEDD